MYKLLAPGCWFRSVEPEEFRGRYLAQLERLDPNQVLSELAELAGDKIPRPDAARSCAARGVRVQRYCVD